MSFKYQFLFILKYCIVLFICIASFKVCFCQRRIANGKISPTGKKYMVYLLNSRYSPAQPEAWLCGGALISDKQILTSAACLTEVPYIYVIAGYTKYVPGHDIDEDECTKNTKRKLVEIIIPTGFSTLTGHAKPDTWMEVDIGIGLVEKPYDFTDTTYHSICSYEPGSILINFDKNFETPNTPATALGWGGTKARKPGEKGDLNSEYLREARTVITNTSFCANYVGENLRNVVFNSMICTFGTDIDTPGNNNDCDWRRFNLNEHDDIDCLDEELDMLKSRRSNRRQPDTEKDNGRKHSDGGGICENDHGGPLISWIGKTEIIIGVALTSIHNVKYECQGPFLYVSTAKAGSIIQCMLAESNETRALCSHLNNDVKTIKVNWSAVMAMETETMSFVPVDLPVVNLRRLRKKPETLMTQPQFLRTKPPTTRTKHLTTHRLTTAHRIIDTTVRLRKLSYITYSKRRKTTRAVPQPQRNSFNRVKIRPQKQMSRERLA